MSRLFRRHLIVVAAAMLALTATGPARGDAVGAVTRLRGEASAQLGPATAPLAEGAALAPGVHLRTGPGARLEARLADGSDLILGERADFIIDQLILAPDRGNALFTRLAGAFQFVAGTLAQRPRHNIVVANDVGTIGIRGTAFWAGAIKGLLDVYLIEGVVEVTSRGRGGSVLLYVPGFGTHINAPGGPPDEPIRWPAALRDRALGTTSFATP